MTSQKAASSPSVSGSLLEEIELMGFGFEPAAWESFQAEFRAATPELSVPGPFRVQVVDDPQHQDAAWERTGEGEGLLVLVFGQWVILGRFGGARPAICPACLRYWLLTTGWLAERSVGCCDPAAAARLVVEALRGGELESTANSVTVHETITGSRASHPLAARTNCRVCAGMRGQGLARQSPEAHLSPVTGIVHTVHCEERLGVFVSSALFAAPRRMKGSPPAMSTRSSLGRGLSAAQASDGCIFEALEHYSFVHRGTERLTRARLDEIGGLDPQSILLFSPRQYAERATWNLHAPARHAVPEAFDAARPIEWLRGSDLTTGETVWVPAACCLTSYMFAPGEPQFARADNAGSASGRTIVEATLGALYESVERDAVSVWWYNRLRRPAVEPRSFEEPALLEIGEKLQQAGRGLYLLDVTADTGLPTYVAVSTREDGTQTVFGAACDASPQVAALKAATEAVQFLYAIERYGCHAEIAAWFARHTESHQMFLEPAAWVEAPPEPAPTVADEALARCISRLQQISLRPVAVNLSRPDVLCPVVRVLMRHIGNRRGAGRLYEVPVRMLWRTTSLTEYDLNPICCVA